MLLSKVEGPTTSLIFLGIHLNTITMKASISEERKSALLDELHWMKHRTKCTKRELLSLIGKLSFCCKVLPAGRIFLHHMIDLTTTVPYLHYRISLTAEAKLDFQWWLDFLPCWLGKSLILNTRWTPSPALNFYTDTSGLHGWVLTGMEGGLVPCTKQDGHHMEGAICYCIGSTYMGILLAPPEGARRFFSIVITKPWLTSGTGAQPVLHTQWLWFAYCIFVLVVTT